MTRPLLFLDVDGPLIPFGGTREEFPDGYPTYAPQEAGVNPLLARVDPAFGPKLPAPASQQFDLTGDARRALNVPPRRRQRGGGPTGELG